MNLNAPDNILNNENIEFEILVDRIEAQCMRIADDNKRLEKISTKVDAQMETAVQVKDVYLSKAIKERHEVTKQKEDLVEEYQQSKEACAEMRRQLGKFEKHSLIFLYSK